MNINDLQRQFEKVSARDAAIEAFRFFLEKTKQEVIDTDTLQAEISDYLAANSQFGVGA